MHNAIRTQETRMNNNNGQTSIEALTEQVGRLTEGLTEFKTVMSDGLTDIRNLVERIALTTEQQAAVAQTQAASVDRLTKIVEGLLENR
jgi:methyl-accepting chemotaxis protein